MSENADETRQDVRHDPAHHPGDPDDWASEGGAVNEGPSTHPADAEVAESEQQQEETRRSSDGTED